MAKKWAIVVGIDQYKRLQPLRYAERDAQSIRDFLVRDANFDQVYYFTSHAPEIVLDGVSIATQPTVANLRRFLELRFATPCLKQGDLLWVFFSGYGLQYADADYLMPSDAEPDAAETTAITVDALADCLNRSGTDQIVLFLDACRTEDQKFGQGFGTDPNGVVSIFSSAFGETAQEIEALRRSAFTHVLLEGLNLKGRKSDATVAQLVQYLCDRLPQVNQSYNKPSQMPRLSANAAIAPEAMLLPQIGLSQPSNLPTAQAQMPPLPTEEVVPLLANQRTKQLIQAGVASGMVLILGFAGITVYRVLNRYFNGPDRWTELWAKALAKKPPSPVPSPATFTLKDNFYQRLPRPGTYYATTSLFNQSYREISNVNGRFCIKLVDAFAKASGEQQVIVSTLSFRENGVYVDATRERLKVDGTFTEITDSKSTWQWSQPYVDRSGPVAECLSSATSYVHETKNNN